MLSLRRRNELLNIPRCWKGLTTEGVVGSTMDSNACPKNS